MDCSEFLRGLSDFRDGLVRDETTAAAYESHRRGCLNCSRLMAALDLGLDTLRDRDEPEPSPGFRGALEHRLRAEVAIGDPVIPTHAGLAAALLMAAALGLLVYEGLSRTGPGRGLTPSIASPAGAFPEIAPRLPHLQDVTLPPFADSQLRYSGQQPPLGTLASLTH
jgi:hypothetical protein